MKKTLLAFLFLFPIMVMAHQPWLVEYENYQDTKTIENPQVSKAFYAELTDFPHNYEFSINEGQEIFIELLVPDIEGAQTDKNFLLVKRNPGSGIELVSRGEAVNASWESYREVYGGDSYKNGPSFRDDLPPGDYLLEVSSADNLGKYVLVVGELEDFSDLGVGELYSRIYQVKLFFDKPPIAVLQSPFYYVPTIIIILLGGLLYWFYRKKHVV